LAFEVGGMLYTKENEVEGVELSGRLYVFLILGIALVFIGIAVLMVASMLLGGSGSVGVIIFIGPFPIVFGSGPNAVWLILIGIILATLSIILFLVMNRRLSRFKN
jgi:uncharacterized membrane protein